MSPNGAQLRRNGLYGSLVRFVGVLLAVLGVNAQALAHPAVSTAALIRVERDGRFELTLIHDALALALADTPQNIPDEPMFDLLRGPPAELDRALSEAADRFQTLCVLDADGSRVPLSVVSRPSVGEVQEQRDRRPAYPLPIKLELIARATLPASASRFRVRFPEMLGPVAITVHCAGSEPLSMPLGIAEFSPEFDCPGGLAAGATNAAPAGPDGPQSAPPGWWSVAVRFAKLGFTHIIPRGADHALFVLGLFLLVPRPRPVLIQVSAFTVAHTLTLTLTALNLVAMPGSIVEPAIAASIVFVGVENLCVRGVSPWRVLVAFAFGLVHGMGVATSFREAGFPPGQLVSSLAAFTVGVEAGHIAYLTAAFLVLGWMRSRRWYRPCVAVPLSIAISGVAVFWLCTRLGL